MDTLRRVSKEAWLLLMIVAADCLTSYVLIQTGRLVEVSPFFFICGQSLFLFFIVKAVLTLGRIGFLEAIRIYPDKMKRLFIPLFPGAPRKLLLQPIWWLRLVIVLYIGIWVFVQLKPFWWYRFLKILGFEP